MNESAVILPSVADAESFESERQPHVSLKGKKGFKYKTQNRQVLPEPPRALNPPRTLIWEPEQSRDSIKETIDAGTLLIR